LKNKAKEITMRVKRVKRMKVFCMYTYEDSMVKPVKHCLKEEGRGRGNGNITKGVNLFKLHCINGIITMKSPYIINVKKSKCIKKKLQ
jgi:hypothetical protein